MDEELRLWAISVDQVRRCFAAPPDLAERLREITNSVVPDNGKRPRNMLSWLGPLLRHPISAPVIRPGVPNRQDAESMMIGRFTASDRLTASWVLVQAWLDSLAMAHTTIPLPQDKIDNLEFDLVRAGVSTQIGIRRLWGRSLDIPLRTTDEMSIGYTEYATLEHLVDRWTSAMPELEEDTIEFATPLVEFLGGFTEYAATTAEQGEPPPDLIAWWTCR